MGFGQYILDKDGTPRLEPNLFIWAIWLETFDRRVQQDRFTVDGQDVRVSTVFLGLDQRPHAGRKIRTGKPVLWETMIFGGERDGYCDRYSSRADALRGHAVALGLAKGTQELEKLIALKDTR
jgi:hypothetical protein